VPNPIIKFIQSVCVQDAVVWYNPTPDGYGGNTYSSKAIKCRWEDTSKKIVSKDGEEVVASAQIMVVDTSIKLGDWIGLCNFATLSTEQKKDPTLVEGAYQIKRIEKTPLFKSKTEFVMVIYV
jgi:hypothetical protein